MVLMEVLHQKNKKKRFGINFTEANTKLCLSWHQNTLNSYLLVNEQEIFKFNAGNKNLPFQLNFVSEVFLIDLVLLSLEKCL